MSVRRHLRSVLAVTAVFGAGWIAGRLGGGRGVAHAEASPPAAGAAQGEPATCTDRTAMEANANLVGQVHDYKGQLERAREHARDAELRASAHPELPARLSTTREEWARMARDRTIRVRVPCSSWNGVNRFILRRPSSPALGSGVAHTLASDQRAAASGLSSEELETLAEAYQRAQARTWALMRPTCEANATFRELMAEREGGDDTDPAARTETCRSVLLDIDEDSSRAALVRVAELRAAGGRIERTSGDEQRVAFALTSATEALYEEMTLSLGREKALRAIDNGVLCLSETLFDLREREGAHVPDEG